MTEVSIHRSLGKVCRLTNHLIVFNHFKSIICILYTHIHLYIYTFPPIHYTPISLSLAKNEGKAAEEKGQKLLHQAGEKEVRISTDGPWNIPLVPPKYQYERISFINRWLRVWGMFQRYVGVFLDVGRESCHLFNFVALKCNFFLL